MTIIHIPNYTAYIFNMLRSLRVIVIEEVRNYGKIVFIKNIVENGW